MRDMNHWVAVRWVVFGLGPYSLLFTASPVVGSAGLSAGNDLSVVCPIPFPARCYIEFESGGSSL